MKKLVLSTIILSGTSLVASAQADSVIGQETALLILISMVFIVAMLVLGLSVRVYQIIRALMIRELEEKAKKTGVEYVPEPDLYDRILQSWTKSVPVEEEESIELDHEYDGIRELDNHLPPWWLALFYGSIVFGIVYIIGYHFADWWPLQEEEYEIAMAAAEEQQASNTNIAVYDESTIEYNDDPEFLAAGKAAYEKNCFSCHRKDGGGVPGLGPNLTDGYWLHGGEVSDIFRTITYGVVQNGMAAWEKTLTSETRAQISSYIYSLYGTDPADAREPQGELVRTPELEQEQVESDTTSTDVDSLSSDSINQNEESVKTDE